MNASTTFFIKKSASFLLMPVTIVFILGFISWWYLIRGNLKKAKTYLIISLFWLVFISSAPVGKLLLAPLENQYKKIEIIPKNIKYLLVLGGDSQSRAWEVVRLYQKSPQLIIITSGASNAGLSEAKKLSKLLINAGIRENQILMQEKTIDTNTEALAIKKRIGKAPFLLVTSAYHMPRAMKIFRRAGTNPVAAPGDFNDPDEDAMSSIFEASQILKIEHALHEYLGLLWLRIKN